MSDVPIRVVNIIVIHIAIVIHIKRIVGIIRITRNFHKITPYWTYFFFRMPIVDTLFFIITFIFFGVRHACIWQTWLHTRSCIIFYSYLTLHNFAHRMPSPYVLDMHRHLITSLF